MNLYTFSKMNFRDLFKFNIYAQIEHEKEIKSRIHKLQVSEKLSKLYDEAANYQYRDDNIAIDNMVAQTRELEKEYSEKLLLMNKNKSEIYLSQRDAYRIFLSNFSV